MIDPKTALKKLQDGNHRFTSGVRSVEPLLSHLKMKELAEEGQKPFAIILTCSDSRSPAEMIFDAGVGELFVIRVAGNIVAPSLLASIEFAAANFGTKLVLVLGHTQCGAVKAAVDHSQHPAQKLPSANLEELISRLRPAVDETVEALGPKAQTASVVSATTIANVRRSQRLILEQSSILKSLVDRGSVEVHGAVLNISSGQVEFLGKNPQNEPVQFADGASGTTTASTTN